MINFNEFVQSKNKFDKLIEFCETRKAGAEKIANKAKAKGGLSLLTYWHFNYKLPIYDEIIKELKNKKLPDLKRKFSSAVNQMKIDHPQKRFQELAGEAEVLGEVQIEINKHS